MQTYNSPKTDDMPIISSKRKSIRSKNKNNDTHDTTANNYGIQGVVVDYEKQWWTLNRCETVLMMPEKELETSNGGTKKNRTEK